MISPGGAARGQTVNRFLTDGRRGAVPSTTPHDLRSRLRISPTPPLSLCYDRTRLRRANETKPSGQMERQVWEGLTNFNTPARAQPIQARSPCLPDMSRASDRPPTSLCPRQSGASMYLRWSATPVPAVLRHVLRPLWVRAPTRTRDAPGPLLLARRRPPLSIARTKADPAASCFVRNPCTTLRPGRTNPSPAATAFVRPGRFSVRSFRGPSRVAF